MSSISAVVPAFSVTEELRDLALDCIRSFKDQVDELIVTDDSDVYWPELHEIADIYIVHPRYGYQKNCNVGWKIAKGDHILHVNTDAKLLDGNLQELCVDGVGIPRCMETGNEWHTSTAMSGFFMVSKRVSTVWGYWDEVGDGTWSGELFQRYEMAKVPFIRVPTVRISHPRAGGTSYFKLGEYRGRGIIEQ